jgi:hypothetical protein
VREWADEWLCFLLVQFDTHGLAEFVEAFDEPFDILQWEEEIGVVNE